MNCLMIKLRDKRKFLTSQKNLKNLLEFAKTFHAELSIVSVQGKKPMSLEKLASEICDTNSKNQDFQYKVVKKIGFSKTAMESSIFNHVVRVLRTGKCIDEGKIFESYKKRGVDHSLIHSQIIRAKRYLSCLGMQVTRRDGKIYIG